MRWSEATKRTYIHWIAQKFLRKTDTLQIGLQQINHHSGTLQLTKNALCSRNGQIHNGSHFSNSSLVTALACCLNRETFFFLVNTPYSPIHSRCFPREWPGGNGRVLRWLASDGRTSMVAILTVLVTSVKLAKHKGGRRFRGCNLLARRERALRFARVRRWGEETGCFGEKIGTGGKFENWSGEFGGVILSELVWCMVERMCLFDFFFFNFNNKIMSREMSCRVENEEKIVYTFWIFICVNIKKNVQYVLSP